MRHLVRYRGFRIARNRISLMHILRNTFELNCTTNGVDSTQNMNQRHLCIALSFFFVSVCLTPISSAASGLAWAGAAESEFGYGSAVQYSPNGDILASAHESTIMITDTDSREHLQTFHVDFFVESIAFSSDAQYLLIGMESNLPNTPATVVYELIDGLYERTMHSEDGKNVDRLSVSHDDSTFATATEDGHIAEWKINTGTGSNLELDRVYATQHTGHISCLDHSTDGLHLLSGDADGLVVLWERQNQTEISRWENNHPVTDCKFSNDGTVMAWMGGGSLYLRNHDSTQSYFGYYDISSNASQMSFTSNDNEIAVLSSDVVLPDYRRVDFIDHSSLPITTTRTLNIGHKAVMMSLHPYANELAIATLSHLVAFYSDSIAIETEIPNSVDTDQDNIPDNIDDDDDGDGIKDVYDNICIAGTNCHLQPDQDFIRQLRISVNRDAVTVVETIHLDAVQSSNLRILASTSLLSNHRVDTDEYAQMQFSICSEYDDNEVKTRWQNHLDIGGQAFIPNSVQCVVESADLYGTMDSDRGTRISISWHIEGALLQPVQAPYNITVISGIQTPTASIAQNVHTFPIHLEFEDVSGTRADYEIWNRRDSDLKILIDIPPVEEPNTVESFVDLLLTYWYAVVFILTFCVVTVWFGLTSYRNTVDFSELSGVGTADSEDDEWEQLVDDAAAWDEEMEEEYTQKRRPTPPAAVVKDIRGKPKPPGAVRRDIQQQKTEDPEVHQQPVMKTRKTKPNAIDDSEESVDFKHLVDMKEDTTESIPDDDEAISDAIAFITSEPEEKSKRRRPVRRKKKSSD